SQAPSLPAAGQPQPALTRGAGTCYPACIKSPCVRLGAGPEARGLDRLRDAVDLLPVDHSLRAEVLHLLRRVAELAHYPPRVVAAEGTVVEASGRVRELHDAAVPRVLTDARAFRLGREVVSDRLRVLFEELAGVDVSAHARDVHGGEQRLPLVRRLRGEEFG